MFNTDDSGAHTSVRRGNALASVLRHSGAHGIVAYTQEINIGSHSEGAVRTGPAAVDGG